MVNEQSRPKYGNSLYGAFGEPFLTADGERVMVIGLTRRQWDLLRRCTGLGDELDVLADRLGMDFTHEGDRFRARKQITAVFEPWFAARRLDDFASAFDEAGVTWSVFRTFDQAVRTDEGLSTDGALYSMVEQPGIGTYPVPGSPLDFSAVPRTEPRRAARLGEHTDEILSGVLGLSDTEISALRERRVVGGPRP
jgi:2-methylfumaryl-CoA isomerase